MTVLPLAPTTPGQRHGARSSAPTASQQHPPSLTTSPRRMYLPRAQIGLVIEGHRTLLLLPHTNEPSHHPPHRAGTTIALQTSPTKRATCRVAVTRVTDIALRELDDEQARQLGQRDLDALMQSWVETHGMWNENARAWLITIALDSRASTRLLIPASGRHGLRALRGYTNNPHEAMPGEPEAVDEFALAGNYRAAAAREHADYDELLQRRKNMDPARRLELVRSAATARGVNIDRDLRAFARCLDAAERRVYRPVERLTAA